MHVHAPIRYVPSYVMTGDETTSDRFSNFRAEFGMGTRPTSLRTMTYDDLVTSIKKGRGSIVKQTLDLVLELG